MTRYNDMLDVIERICGVGIDSVNQGSKRFVVQICAVTCPCLRTVNRPIEFISATKGKN